MSRTTFLAVLSAGALAAPALAQDWSAEVYGGGVFDRSEDLGGTSFRLGSGSAYGMGIYNRSFLTGTELGLDIMRSEADYDGSGAALDATSFMLNARMPFAIGDGTTAYVGAGLGAINVDLSGAGDETVPGGQIGLGIRYDFPAFSAFGEIKHQMTFEDADVGGLDQSYEATSAVVGLRFAF